MPIKGAIRAAFGPTYYGDQERTADAERLVAGNQKITGKASEALTNVYGDAMFSYGVLATVIGGDDNIKVSATSVAGDLWRASGHKLVSGGDDRITMLENRYNPGPVSVTGDVQQSSSGTFKGGDDTITGYRDKAFGTSIFIGDAGNLDFGGKARGGRDRIKATDIDDRIFGDFFSTDASVDARAGNDRIWGFDGDDLIFGDADEAGTSNFRSGNDTIRGGSGADEIYGDVRKLLDASGTQVNRDGDTKTGGDDVISGGGGKDTIRGGGGDDTINGDGGNDRIQAGRDDDEAWGGGGGDRIDGEAGSDRLHGGKGGDQVRGGKGNDRLWGDGGGDRIVMTAGKDVATGGKGADVFEFRDSARGDWNARIKDFSSGQNDRIDLSRVAEIKNWKDLQKNHLTSASDGSAIIHTDPGVEQVRLDGVDAGDLEKGDFIF